MGTLVENNEVKMDWEKAGWFQKATARGKKPAFIFGSKTYKSKLDKYNDITVFFDGLYAFIWCDDYGTDNEDIWTADDLISTIKEQGDVPSGFPNMFDNFVYITNGISPTVEKMDVLEHFGIEEFADDIVARMLDLEPYTVEQTVTME